MPTHMSWLQQHAQVIAAVANTAMALTWLVYAWLFYDGFRRQRSARLFIHQVGGTDVGDTCMLVNLSTEPVHVIRVTVARDDTAVRLRATSSNATRTVMQQELQGPLQPGESMTLGTFADLDSALEGSEIEVGSELEIRVAALHGFRTWSVGARRVFHLRDDHQVIPDTLWTQQLHAKRHRREVRRWIEND